ncbi:MAG: cytochrome c peroxidase [Bacteroidia bacterium]
MRYSFLLNKSLIAIFVLFFILSCKKNQSDIVYSGNDIQQDTTPYLLTLPKYYPDIPAINQMKLTNAKVFLGKKLYRETLLSNNGKSCASCHISDQSFSNSSINSLPHINLIFNTNFLWNGKIYQSGLMSAMLFEVNDFFGTHPNNIQTTEYRELFSKAYGDDNITNQRIAECLGQYISTLITGNSKFDKYLRGEVILNENEFNGFNIFMTEKGDCFHCHPPPLFTDNQFHNIGLDSTPFLQNGLFDITHNINDKGKFKTPTLYNLLLTPPYMHDGRFSTLEQVIEHYNSGVKYSPTLDPIMTKKGLTPKLFLTEQEKSDLVAFLKTLTDSSILNK